MNISTTRSILTAISVITMVVLLVLVFVTSFPWWLGLILAIVILLPMQMYLNKLNPKRNSHRNDH